MIARKKYHARGARVVTYQSILAISLVYRGTYLTFGAENAVLTVHSAVGIDHGLHL